MKRLFLSGIAALSVLYASAAHAREWQGNMPPPVGPLPHYPPVTCVTPDWRPEPCESRKPVAPATDKQAGEQFPTIPPPEYDHLYDGELHVVGDLDLFTLHYICKKPALACATHSEPGYPRHCIIFLAREDEVTKRGHTMETLRRHEIGHCNGWPPEHPGPAAE